MDLRNRQLPGQNSINTQEAEVDDAFTEGESAEVRSNISGNETSATEYNTTDDMTGVTRMTAMQEQMQERMTAMKEEIQEQMRQQISNMQEMMLKTLEGILPVSQNYGNSCNTNVGQTTGNSYMHDREMRYYNMPSADEPKPRLPSFNGKNTAWESFWIQFQMLANRYRWRTYRQTEELFLCLQDDALEYATNLIPEVRCDIYKFQDAMKQRFGDHTLPETYRLQLKSMHQKSDETVQEFSSRISTIMNKAYPGLRDEQLKAELAIEHLLNGLNDQNIAYEVAIKRPKTVQSAVDMITWHECCKSVMRRNPNVTARLVNHDDYHDDNENRQVGEIAVQRVNAYKNGTNDKLGQVLQSLQEVLKVLGQMDTNDGSYNGGYRKVVCYGCHEEGHIRKNCPLSRQTDRLQSGQETCARNTDRNEPLNAQGLGQ